MSERSFFYDGTTKGDAQEAPYSADLFAHVVELLHTSNGAYGNPPVVQASGINMVLTVTAGSALIKGRYISATGNPITVPSNTSTLPRLDRVVFRVNLLTNTGSVTLKQGTPNYAPESAELIQDDNIYEMPLYRVYVPPATVALSNAYLVDERTFYTVLMPGGAIQTTNENLMPNSEFMAGAGTTFDGAPAMWNMVGTATCEVADKFDEMARGSCVKVTCPANTDGISITVPRLMGGSGAASTIKLLINVSEGLVLIDLGGGFGSAYIPPTSGVVEVIFRPGNISSLALSVTNASTDPTVFTLGQVTLAQGYEGAPYLPKKETVLFGIAILVDPLTFFFAPANLDYLLTGTVNGGYRTPIQEGISSLISLLNITDDDSSSTNTCWAALQDPVNLANQIRIEIGRLTSFNHAIAQGFLGVPFNDSGVQHFRLEGVPSGNMNFYIYHLGVVT